MFKTFLESKAVSVMSYVKENVIPIGQVSGLPEQTQGFITALEIRGTRYQCHSKVLQESSGFIKTWRGFDVVNQQPYREN